MILAERLRSPGEQQTELVQRHYSAAAFYRIDVRLTRDYPLDSQGRELDDLERIGRRLAATIGWPAILEAREEPSRVVPGRVTSSHYCREVG